MAVSSLDRPKEIKIDDFVNGTMKLKVGISSESRGVVRIWGKEPRIMALSFKNSSSSIEKEWKIYEQTHVIQPIMLIKIDSHEPSPLWKHDLHPFGGVRSIWV